MSRNPKTLSFHTKIAGTANGCPPNFILQIWNTIWNDDLTAMERYQTIGFDPSPYLSISGCRLCMSSCCLPAQTAGNLLPELGTLVRGVLVVVGRQGSSFDGWKGLGSNIV